ncbi:hypothetical protein A8924_6422 [Saccharopolyspora erythraea NRRL 2338]|uniref:hypothetical protein n=1 Tax=Saccharopolyspora erythraea TaxID=1836 RepID=UPI0002D83F97|nr:hypothetical protein A8924_6422 [Saccharopolyspora erythraea NRRL 2338]
MFSLRNKRFLRPGHLVPLDGLLWVLDEFQPVAALVDPDTALPRAVVDWRELPPPAPDSATWVVTDHYRLWVQQGTGGPIGRVDEGGLRQVADPGGADLVAVGRGAAWCVDSRSPDPGTPGGPGVAPVPPPRPGSRLVVVAEDGGARTIAVDRPTESVTPRPDGIYLRVHGKPPTAVPMGDPRTVTGWGYAYHAEHLRLTEPLPDRIEYEQYEKREPDMEPPLWNLGGAGPWTPWHDPEEVTRYGLRAGGLRWALGALAHQPLGDRYPLVATGHDPESGRERVRVDLGTGWPRAAAECGGFLWALAGTRTRQLLRIDPLSARAEALPQVGSIDIADRCWPLVGFDADEVEEHAERERARFEDAGRYLRLSDARSEIEGEWPDLRVRLAFRHPHLPGGWLRRRWRVFDEVGRPTSETHADVHLMEDLETGQLPPPEEAVDGVLDI